MIIGTSLLHANEIKRLEMDQPTFGKIKSVLEQNNKIAFYPRTNQAWRRIYELSEEKRLGVTFETHFMTTGGFRFAYVYGQKLLELGIPRELLNQLIESRYQSIDNVQEDFIDSEITFELNQIGIPVSLSDNGSRTFGALGRFIFYRDFLSWRVHFSGVGADELIKQIQVNFKLEFLEVDPASENFVLVITRQDVLAEFAKMARLASLEWRQGKNKSLASDSIDHGDDCTRHLTSIEKGNIWFNLGF